MLTKLHCRAYFSFFFDDNDDELYIFIPVVNVQIFNATEELAIPEETPTNDANAEIEAHE